MSALLNYVSIIQHLCTFTAITRTAVTLCVIIQHSYVVISEQICAHIVSCCSHFLDVDITAEHYCLTILLTLNNVLMSCTD
jgi:hypothetical protein